MENASTIVHDIFNIAWPIILMLLPVVTALVLKQIKDDKNKSLLADAVDIAYLVVNQISRKTDTKIDDKIGEALKVIKDQMGKKNLKESDVTKATQMLMAKHESINHIGN